MPAADAHRLTNLCNSMNVDFRFDMLIILFLLIMAHSAFFTLIFGVGSKAADDATFSEIVVSIVSTPSRLFRK